MPPSITMQMRGANASHLWANIRAYKPGSSEDSGSLTVVDRLLESQTLSHFGEFCSHGILPNGKQSTLPRPTQDEMDLLEKPYNTWAPSPYNNRTVSAAHLTMERIGSEEDYSRLAVVEKSVAAHKSRLWEGITLLSQNRWRAMHLDESEQFPSARQYLGTVIATFDYLNVPKQAANLRETYNLIWDHLQEFELALNSLRTTKGKDAVSMTSLWEEFIRAQYQLITTRAHSWVLDHIDALRQPILDDLLAHSPPSEDHFSPEQWDMTNKLHDLTELASRADYTIVIPMDGYKGYSPPALNATNAIIKDFRSADINRRRKAHIEELSIRARAKIIHRFFQTLHIRPVPGLANSGSIVENYTFQTEAQDEIRVESRGKPEPLPAEGWISDLLRHRKAVASAGKPCGHPGFIIYRLVYQQSEEEWAAFLQKLDADLLDWGDGIAGAGEVRSLLKLQWLNGKELGIVEGDIAAATEHFKKHYGPNNAEHTCTSPGLQSHVFLAVDAASFTSYDSNTHSTDEYFPDDHTGFVLAVELDFNPEDPYRPEECPGYKGELRILTSLVWCDLYAMLGARTQGPWDLWRLAMDHPEKVYVGPTVDAHRTKWEKASKSGETLSNDPATQ